MLAYRTVPNSGHSEINVKKSRFIATVLPVVTKAAALNGIEEIKKEHRKAQHNVFAFTVGTAKIISQCSDDGEPAGTAGPVVLEVLRQEALYNTAIIITRYFGGTRLGAGGLIRAYARAAKAGIQAAGIIRKVRHQGYNLEFAYHYLGPVENYLQNCGCPIAEVNYTARVGMDVLVPIGMAHEFRTAISELTGGQSKIIAKSETYLNCPTAAD